MASEYPDVFEWLTYDRFSVGATPVGPGQFSSAYNGTVTTIYCTYCGADVGTMTPSSRIEAHIRSHEYDALMQKVIRQNNFANARAELVELRKELHVPEPPSTYEPYQLADPEIDFDDYDPRDDWTPGSY